MMNARRRIGIALGVGLLAAVAIGSWWLGSREAEKPPPIRVLEVAPAPQPGKPSVDAGASRGAEGPFAREQPPVDYLGDPDAGLRSPPPRPPRVIEHEVPSAAELRERRREMVALLEREMAELERAAARAEAAGHDASALRARRREREARRDALVELIERE